jgi:glycolate oxidase FAD binding subunit
MDRIEEYEPADLTLTAGGGVTLDGLAAATAEHEQWLPLDPPGGGEGTLGAAVATGASGPLAYRYGSVRDLVLGATVVTGDGRILRLGGRVVKNVAGFDLVRLVVGSWGGLGLVCQATVRLYPTPHAVLRLEARADRAEDLVAHARDVARSSVVPARLELWERPEADGGVGASLRITLHGTESAVAAEAARLKALAPGLDPVPDHARSPGRPGPDALVVRLRVAPGDPTSLLHAARELANGELLAKEALEHRLRLDPLTGTARLVISLGVGDAGGLGWAERLVEARRKSEASGGSLVIEAAPEAVVRGAGAWAPPSGAERRLMEGLRDRFDPHRTLVPGGFGF